MNPIRRLSVLLCAVPLLLCACVATPPATSASKMPAASVEPTVPPPSLVASAAGTASVGPTAAVEATSEPRVPVLDVSGYLGQPIRRAKMPTNAVALTLDDGPSGETSAVLGVLERYSARVTFFYVGNRVARWRRLMPRVRADSCEIGNHTYDHEEIRGVSRSQVLREVDRGQAVIGQYTGVTPVLMRPPTGHFDETSLEAVNSRHLVLALWSLHGQDTGSGTHAETIARGIIGSTRGGDVILLHETNPETVKALPVIIEGLKRKGLHLVTMSELLGAH